MINKPRPDPLLLKRNDPAGAARIYRESILVGVTPDQQSDLVAILMQLQDDSDELELLLDAVDAEPEVADALGRRRS